MAERNPPFSMDARFLLIALLPTNNILALISNIDGKQLKRWYCPLRARASLTSAGLGHFKDYRRWRR